AVRLVEGREADEPVYPPFCLQDPVGVLALDREGGRLESRLLPRARLEKLGLEAAVGGPAEVHSQHDLGPVLRVRATGPSVDRDHRVTRVVLAREESVLLQPLELTLERLECLRDLRSHVSIHGEQLACILELPTQALVALQAL